MFSYKTHGTCSVSIDLEIDENNKITHCQFHRGFVVLRGAPAVVRMDVAHRHADDNARHAFLMDDARVGPAAGTDRFLDRDLVCPGEVQGVALEARACYHAAVKVAQHGTLVKSGLDHVRLLECIVSGTALKAYHEVRLKLLVVGVNAAFADFFLHRERRLHLRAYFFAFEALNRLNFGRNAYSAVKCLTEEKSFL